MLFFNWWVCLLIYLYSLKMNWFLLDPTCSLFLTLIIISLLILWAACPLLNHPINTNSTKLMINSRNCVIANIYFIQVVDVAVIQLKSYLRWKYNVWIYLHLLLVYIRLVHHFHLGCNAVRRSPKWSRSIGSRQWTQWASIISLLAILSA